MEYIFWISLFLIFYTFLGYGMLLYVLVKLKRLFSKPSPFQAENLPSCTLVVAAFNEEEFLEEKIRNTLELEYPAGTLKYFFVSDGSSDRTPEIIQQYPQITEFHQPERRGKIHAVHRVMEFVDTDVVVFTDANTLLNKKALIKLCRHYADRKVGAVAGEKRVSSEGAGDATSGEGFYWKYESKLKKWDSELYSVVGAAGELFSIRRDLYVPVSPDSILDDFMVSMRIAEKGYRIVYEPDAFATETASENVGEELKRKIRIAAGGIQSIIWLKNLFIPFKYPVLTFQYISHRVLRWTITPFLLFLVFFLNVLLVNRLDNPVYDILLWAQVLFYLIATGGWLLARRDLKVKALFIPYYFCLMNYAVLIGIYRYIFGAQSVLWEKARRKQ
ncbi:MAG TPA: glycosyltransferase family 2 protein [Sphingobacteriaceae bacterium]